MAPGAQASHGPASPNTPPEEVPLLPPSSVTPPVLEPPDEPLLVVDPEPEPLESALAPLSKPSLEPADAPEEQDASRHAANIGIKRTMEGPSVMTRTSTTYSPSSSQCAQRRKRQ